MDDQAAGGDSSGFEGNSDSPSPNQPGHRQRSSQHGRGQLAAATPVDMSKNSSSSSSSSEDDRPLAAKRHRSTSLQRQSPASDSDSLSSPAKLTDHGVTSGSAAGLDDARGHQQTAQKQRSSLTAPGAKRRQRASKHDRPSAKNVQGQLGLPSPAAAGGVLPSSHDGRPIASSLGRASTPRQEGEDDRGQDEGAVLSAVGEAEDEQPAVMVPSQMPRELQSWAWDK